MRRLRTNRKSRYGVAALEFALVAPLLLVFLFGFFELGQGLMLDSIAENTAYEAARQGVIPGATIATVRRAAEEIANASNLNTFEVDVEPAVIDETTDQVTVTVTVPMRENGLLMGSYLGAKQIQRSVTMICESNLRFQFLQPDPAPETTTPRPRGRGRGKNK